MIDSLLFGNSPFEISYEELSIPAGIITGIVVPAVLKQLGMYIGRKGIRYYAEVHTQQLNAYIHSIGMPLFINGMLIVLPMLISDNADKAVGLQNLLFSSYMTHYFIIDPRIGSVTTCVYGVSLVMARNCVLKFYNDVSSPVSLEKRVQSDTFVGSLYQSMIIMLLQETLGHWLSGDPPSRIEGIPNAILYAIYFSISHR